jgi:hypothetical protein
MPCRTPSTGLHVRFPLINLLINLRTGRRVLVRSSFVPFFSRDLSYETRGPDLCGAGPRGSRPAASPAGRAIRCDFRGAAGQLLLAAGFALVSSRPGFQLLAADPNRPGRPRFPAFSSCGFRRVISCSRGDTMPFYHHIFPACPNSFYSALYSIAANCRGTKLPDNAGRK